MGFRRVLVGVDFSPASNTLIEGLGNLKGLGISEVKLLHVIPLDLIDHPAAGFSVERIISEAEEDAKRRLNVYKARLAKMGFSVEVVPPPIGDPAPTIAKYAEKLECDAILVASKGRSRLREILLGSTVEALVRISNKPVLIYREVDGPVEEKPVVVGVDVAYIPPGFRDCLAKLLDTSIRKIFLVYVEEGGYNAREAFKVMDSLVPRRNGVEVHEVYVSRGTPTREIILLAERLGSRLVVVGGHGRGGILRRLLLGSTVDAIARNSPTPTLVCR